MKNSYQPVIILSTCPVAHSKCRVTYLNKKEKEVCFCPCHEHANPPKKEPEPIVGIDALNEVYVRHTYADSE